MPTGEFTQKHNYVSGLLLIAIGAFGLIGSVTGNLAGMFAALSDPTDLYPVVSSGGGLIGIPLLSPPNDSTGAEGSGNSSGGSGGGSNPSIAPSSPSTPSTPEIPSVPDIPVLPVTLA